MRTSRIAATTRIAAVICAALSLLGGVVNAAGSAAGNNARADNAAAIERRADTVAVARGEAATAGSNQLTRFGIEVRNWAEANGSTTGYSADPASFDDLTGELGTEVFSRAGSCSCGELSPEFANLVETPTSPVPELREQAAAARAPQHSAGRILAESAAIAGGVHLAGTAAALWLAVWYDARKHRYQWSSLRYDRNDPNTRRIAIHSPLGWPILNIAAGPTARGHRQALINLGLDRNYDQTVGALADLRAVENPDQSVLDTIDDLEHHLERINVEVAEYDPEQDRTDTSVVARKRAREALVEGTETLDARAAARAELNPGHVDDAVLAEIETRTHTSAPAGHYDPALIAKARRKARRAAAALRADIERDATR